MAYVKPRSREIIVDKQGMELFSHGTVAFPIAFYDVDFTIDRFLWHWHEELEFGVVVDGEMIVSVGSKEYSLKAGDAYFVNAGVLHRGENSTNQSCRAHLIVFHPRLVGGSHDSVYWQDYINPLVDDKKLQGLFLLADVPAQKNVIEIIQAAWNSYLEQAPGYPFQIRNYLSELLLLINGNRDQSNKMPDAKYLRSYQRVQVMMEFISKNYSESITLQDIASSAAISSSECLRCFRQIIHVTPIQYLKDYRIKRAAELLKSTSAQISEIARQCGFVEMSYFSKVFRERYGQSPLDFRKILRSRKEETAYGAGRR